MVAYGHKVGFCVIPPPLAPFRTKFVRPPPTILLNLCISIIVAGGMNGGSSQFWQFSGYSELEMTPTPLEVSLPNICLNLCCPCPHQEPSSQCMKGLMLKPGAEQTMRNNAICFQGTWIISWITPADSHGNSA